MILGISIPGLIAFTAFWLLNVAIGFGGGNILNKFTAVLTPLIYIVFGGNGYLGLYSCWWNCL